VTKYRQLMSLESSHRRETDSGITQKVVWGANIGVRCYQGPAHPT
jgi:hypothetical protein